MKHTFFERLNRFFSPKKTDSQESQRMRLVGAQGDQIKPIATGTRLRLNMDIAVAHLSTLNVAAETVWRRLDPETGAFQNGLRFVDLSREQTAHIKRYLTLLKKGRAC